MVLQLDQSILDYANRGINEERETRVALENILNGYREGNHVVICHPQLAVNLRRRLFSNSSTQSWLLGGLAEEWPIISSHVGHLLTYASVVGDQLIPLVLRSGQVNILKLPISMFRRASLMQPTILLPENLEDSETLKMMGKVFSVRNNLAQILKFEAIGGGGSTTANQFELIQSQEARFCLCIADSDKRSPHDAFGNTARRIREVHNPDKLLVTAAYTPCHELENTIPESIIASALQNFLGGLRDLRCFRDHGIAGSFEHLDFKRGVVLRDLFEFEKTSQNGIFWASTITQAIGSPLPLQNVSQACLDDWACHNPGNCNCRIFESFGNNMLPQVNEFFATNSAHVVSRMLDAHCQPLWEKLGRVVFEWCCGWRSKMT